VSAGLPIAFPHSSRVLISSAGHRSAWRSQASLKSPVSLDSLVLFPQQLKPERGTLDSSLLSRRLLPRTAESIVVLRCDLHLLTRCLKQRCCGIGYRSKRSYEIASLDHPSRSCRTPRETLRCLYSSTCCHHLQAPSAAGPSTAPSRPRAWPPQ
jgi:hypothetical protein